jgi:peptidyl-tRNA hydrolase
MVAHCAEGYWTTLLKRFASLGGIRDNEFETLPVETDDDPNYWLKYRHPLVAKAAQEAHERGEKTFKFPREGYARKSYTVSIEIPKSVWDEYVNGLFVKTICEAKNLNHLMKVKEVADSMGLVQGIDYDFIDDACLTELKPESTDADGKPYCRVGVWFKPLPDDVSHTLSKKYQLYKDHPKEPEKSAGEALTNESV